MVKLSYYSNLGIQDFSKMGLVWNLFSNFGKQTKEEIIQQSRNGAVDRFSFTDKLIEKASSGGINLQQEEFNLGGFDFAHRNFKKLSDFKRLEKEVYLVNEIDKGSDEFQDGYGEYSENRIVEESNDFELVEENLDYTLAWGRFPDLSKKLEKQGYSLLYLLISFIDGSKPARENLSKVCDSDDDVREWIESIFIPDKLPDIRKRLEEFRRLGIFV